MAWRLKTEKKTITLRTLDLPVKVLFTSFPLTIGRGYLLAIAYLFLIDVEPHAKHGTGMVQAVIIKYYGQRGTTRLESALAGSMGEMLQENHKTQIVEWIREGATEASFVQIEPIFREYCTGCHSAESGMAIPPLSSYEEVAAYTQMDMGESIKTLVRVSHIHLFGMSFIFILTSGIFVLSEVRVRWRTLLVAIPFVAIWMDIGSWWFTRLEPLFAYTVIIWRRDDGPISGRSDPSIPLRNVAKKVGLK